MQDLAHHNSWISTIPNKGSKAFSYFSVITKNWFIHQAKKRESEKRRTEVELSEISKDLELKHISDQPIPIQGIARSKRILRVPSKRNRFLGARRYEAQ